LSTTCALNAAANGVASEYRVRSESSSFTGAPDPAWCKPGVRESARDGLVFIAQSSAMRSLRTQVEQICDVDVPVLCVGESGTGKEVVAHLIHQLSPRRAQPFIKVNCAALPSELLESELFGFERGAFTGAARAKPGKFELCGKGTILLDEIAEIAPALQAKLLHVVEHREFSRLGGCTRVEVDVRILAATNANVEQSVAAKQLREDLLYRLSTFVLRIPPLRERRDDIPVLLRHFISRYAAEYGIPDVGLPSNVFNAAMRYCWPGNVRELQNFARRYLVLGDQDPSTADGEHLNGPFGEKSPLEAGGGAFKHVMQDLKSSVEADAIRQALEQAGWNRRKAATHLRVSYKALRYKIRQYAIDPPHKCN
jgi:transcriptional regulator with PAS, ATPase and Fis domain